MRQKLQDQSVLKLNSRVVSIDANIASRLKDPTKYVPLTLNIESTPTSEFQDDKQLQLSRRLQLDDTRRSAAHESKRGRLAVSYPGPESGYGID